MNKLACKGIIFDLDGTLVDSSVDAERCWTAWADSANVGGRFNFAETHGRRRSEIIATVLPELPEAEIAAHAQQVHLAELEQTSNVVALPGAVKLLNVLPGTRWAIVTANDRDVAKARIQAAGLPMPGVLISADEVERSRPDPQGLLRAASMLGIEPDNTLVVDDSPIGIDAAKRGGMSSVAVRFNRKDASISHADLVVDGVNCLAVDFDPRHCWIYISSSCRCSTSEL